MLYTEFKEEARVAGKRIIKKTKDICFFYNIKKDKIIIYDFITKKRSERGIKKNKIGEFNYKNEIYFYNSIKNEEIEVK